MVCSKMKGFATCMKDVGGPIGPFSASGSFTGAILLDRWLPSRGGSQLRKVGGKRRWLYSVAHMGESITGNVRLGSRLAPGTTALCGPGRLLLST